MPRSVVVLPVGWQIAARRVTEASDSQVYYLQRQQGQVWRDVAGPYGQRYGAVQAFGRLMAADAGATRAGGEPGKSDRIIS